METTDRPFLDPESMGRYSGFKTKSISELRFVSWGKIAAWCGSAGIAVVLLAWMLSRYLQ